MQRGEELSVEKEEEEEAAAAWGSLSFRIDSPVRISAVDSSDVVGDDPYRDEDGDLDFSFVRVPETGHPIAAADVFSAGKIRPVYPVFNRDLLFADSSNNKDAKGLGGSLSKSESKPPIRLPLRRLFIEEEEEQSSFSSTSSSSSSSMDELDRIPEGTYCVWAPPSNKGRRKKSSSTGSTGSLRWRLRDLIVSGSQRFSKEKFVITPIQEKEKEREKQ